MRQSSAQSTKYCQHTDDTTRCRAATTRITAHETMRPTGINIATTRTDTRETAPSTRAKRAPESCPRMPATHRASRRARASRHACAGQKQIHGTHELQQHQQHSADGSSLYQLSRAQSRALTLLLGGVSARAGVFWRPIALVVVMR